MNQKQVRKFSSVLNRFSTQLKNCQLTHTSPKVVQMWLDFLLKQESVSKELLDLVILLLQTNLYFLQNPSYIINILEEDNLSLNFVSLTSSYIIRLMDPTSIEVSFTEELRHSPRLHATGPDETEMEDILKEFPNLSLANSNGSNHTVLVSILTSKDPVAIHQSFEEARKQLIIVKTKHFMSWDPRF